MFAPTPSFRVRSDGPVLIVCGLPLAASKHQCPLLSLARIAWRACTSVFHRLATSGNNARRIRKALKRRIISSDLSILFQPGAKQLFCCVVGNAYVKNSTRAGRDTRIAVRNKPRAQRASLRTRTSAAPRCPPGGTTHIYIYIYIYICIHTHT